MDEILYGRRPAEAPYRAVDRDGDNVDFLLRAKRDHAAARAFVERAIDLHGVPENHDRRARLQHGRDRQHSGRQRPAGRDAPVEARYRDSVPFRRSRLIQLKRTSASTKDLTF